jgi:hypothetical protein
MRDTAIGQTGFADAIRHEIAEAFIRERFVETGL